MVYAVKATDVLSGRGNGPNKHPGNIQYRNLIADGCSLYDSSRNPLSKKMIVLKIIDKTHRRGGAFLNYRCGQWEQMDHSKVIKKVRQGLRDAWSDILRNKKTNETPQTHLTKTSIANYEQFVRIGGQKINKSTVDMIDQSKNIYSAVSSDQNLNSTPTHDESVVRYSKSDYIAKAHDAMQISNITQNSNLVEKLSNGSNIATSSKNMIGSYETIASNSRKRSLNTNQESSDIRYNYDKSSSSSTDTSAYNENNPLSVQNYSQNMVEDPPIAQRTPESQRKWSLSTNQESSDIRYSDDKSSISSTETSVCDENNQFAKNYSKNMVADPPIAECIFITTQIVDATTGDFFRDDRGDIRVFERVIVKNGRMSSFDNESRLYCSGDGEDGEDGEDGGDGGDGGANGNGGAATIGLNIDTGSHELNRAYLFEPSVDTYICDAPYGNVFHGTVLQRSNGDTNWQTTGERCAIKAMPWDRMQHGLKKQLESPRTEIATLHHLRSVYNALAAGGDADAPTRSAREVMREMNVVVPLDFLFNDQFLYSIIPFCDGGELLDAANQENFSEEICRTLIVPQMLNGLRWLQKAKVCHTDVSLENFVLDGGGEERRVILIDFGIGVRIPDREDYREQSISQQSRCGKLPYLSPEIFQQEIRRTCGRSICGPSR